MGLENDVFKQVNQVPVPAMPDDKPIEASPETPEAVRARQEAMNFSEFSGELGRVLARCKNPDAKTLLTGDITGIQRKSYRSPLEETYHPRELKVDAFIHIVSFSDGRKAFVLTGKDDRSGTYGEHLSAGREALDNRQDREPFIYFFDGKGECAAISGEKTERSKMSLGTFEQALPQLEASFGVGARLSTMISGRLSKTEFGVRQAE